MIYSLAVLNDAVNSVANHITEQACKETTDGEFQIDLDDIDLSGVTPYMSWEDLHEYKDFIFSELADRPEFEDIDFTDQGFSGTCKREYCPNLADRTPDEPLLKVHDTLSMTELAKIGEKAMEKLAPGPNYINYRDTLGMTFQQLHRLGLTAQDHIFSVQEKGREYGDHKSEFEYKPPRDVLDTHNDTFIFDDELTVEKHECVNGYLWATDDLMKKLLESVVQQERREGYIPGATMENPNFYADYFPADGSISVTSTYYTQEVENGKPVEVQLSVDIPLDKEQEVQLIAILENYCKKEHSKSCLDLVNEDRKYHDIKPLTKSPPDLDILMKDAVDRANGGGEVAHSVPQPERF